MINYGQIDIVVFMKKNKTISKYVLTDKEADKFFEEIEEAENHLNISALAERYGEEQYTYEATPYSYIVDFLNKFAPLKSDIVYDLGSGYGRFIIFCAMNSDAMFRGIEICEIRNQKARELAHRIGLRNVDFITGNVLDADIEDGNIFFLFNPFAPRTMEEIGKKLRKIATAKQIKIATWGGASDDYFRHQDWLEIITELNPETPLEYFVSKKDCA